MGEYNTGIVGALVDGIEVKLVDVPEMCDDVNKDKRGEVNFFF